MMNFIFSGRILTEIANKKYNIFQQSVNGFHPIDVIDDGIKIRVSELHL